MEWCNAALSDMLERVESANDRTPEINPSDLVKLTKLWYEKSFVTNPPPSIVIIDGIKKWARRNNSIKWLESGWAVINHMPVARIRDGTLEWAEEGEVFDKIILSTKKEFDPSVVKGCTFVEAIKLASSNGCEVRIIRLDGVDITVLASYCWERINVAVVTTPQGLAVSEIIRRG